MVVALVADLFFAARVTGTAEQLGVPARAVRSREALLAALPAASGVLLDMNTPETDTAALVAEIKTQRGDLPVVAFLAHVQKELAAAAAAAGADEVLPRSAFSEQLPALLERLGASAA